MWDVRDGIYDLKDFGWLIDLHEVHFSDCGVKNAHNANPLVIWNLFSSLFQLQAGVYKEPFL